MFNRRTIFNWPLTLIMVVVSLAGEGLQAQSAPTAEALQQRQLDDMQRLQQRQQPPLQGEGPLLDRSQLPEVATEILQPGGPSILLQSVSVEPQSSLLDMKWIEAITAPLLATRVSFADLQNAVNQINSLYVQYGHFNARALLPPQQVSQGQVKIQLVEGRLGQTTFENARFIRPTFVQSRLGARTGEVLNLNRLNRKLVWLNRTTDAYFQARLMPGAEFGQTDLAVNVTQRKPVRVAAYMDNTGSASTGEILSNVDLTHASVLGYTDVLNVHLARSQGLFSQFLQYGVPLNQWNGRLRASYAHTQIDIANGIGKGLDITGNSIAKTLQFTQPVYAGSYFKVTADCTLGWVNSENYFDDGNESFAKVRMKDLSGGVSMEYMSDQQYFSSSLHHRHLNDNNSHSKNSLWNADIYYRYQLNNKWHFSSRGAWQYSDDVAMNSARIFQLGGLSSVRGYEEGVLTGSRGYFLNLDAHYKFNDWLTVSAFSDLGQVAIGKPLKASPATRISSVGLGVSTQWQQFNLSASFGRPLQGFVRGGEYFKPDGRLHARLVWAI